jgi:hypothetical protein
MLREPQLLAEALAEVEGVVLGFPQPLPVVVFAEFLEDILGVPSGLV